MNSLVKAVNILKGLDPATRKLAIQLTKPDPVHRRKKPGPKPGTHRKAKVPPPSTPTTRKSRRIEPGEPDTE